MSDCCVPNPGKHYDLAVIGAGSAGFAAAIAVADGGASVVLIGHGTIGGTCVNIGCVPSKTLIRAAEALRGVSVISRFDGLSGEASAPDWGRLVAAKDDLVSTLRREKYADLLPGYQSIDYIEGKTRLHGLDMVEVNGVRVAAGGVVVATGARPVVPDIAGISDVPYLTSTTALELKALPHSVLIVGAGYIGCELAQMFARMRVAVTLVTRTRLLRRAEPEVAEALAGYLRAEGIAIHTDLAYQRIERTEAGVALSVMHNGVSEVLAAEQVLVATGRQPNTEDLGLEDAGVLLTTTGGIGVDRKMRTSRPGIYAAGDVTGRDQFVYMAAHGAKVAALNALNGDRLDYDNAAMPWVTFTYPQVAGVGLTEAAAKARGHRTKTSVVPLHVVARARAARDTRGLVKLVADAVTDRLLGGQILAPEGADSIQTMAMALKFGMTATALAETIFPYLTTVEGLKLAALGFSKDITKLSCCAA